MYALVVAVRILEQHRGEGYEAADLQRMFDTLKDIKAALV
jgi:hypothetical protein